MQPKELFSDAKVQNVTLWTLAVVFVALATANIPLFGIEPIMLAILATVFAALSTTYNWTSATA